MGRLRDQRNRNLGIGVKPPEAKPPAQQQTPPAKPPPLPDKGLIEQPPREKKAPAEPEEAPAPSVPVPPASPQPAPAVPAAEEGVPASQQPPPSGSGEVVPSSEFQLIDGDPFPSGSATPPARPPPMPSLELDDGAPQASPAAPPPLPAPIATGLEVEEAPAVQPAVAAPAMAPVVRKEKRSGTASFLNRLDQCSLPAGYKLQFTQAVGMEKLDFYLVGNDPQPVQLELSRTDAPKSTKLSLEGGRVAMTLTYKGKNEKTNAHDVDYEVEYGVTEKARWGGAFGAFARKAGASAWKYLPHVLVVAAGVAIATLGLMSDFLKDTLKAGFYPTVGAVFVAIEAFAITSILARTKELREQRE